MVNLLVDNVDVLYAEFLAQGVPIAEGVPIAGGPVDQTWGTGEMYVKDADGNCIRFMS